MKKGITTAIITTMVLGFLSWNAIATIDNLARISILETKEQSAKEILLEIKSMQKETRQDIRTLLILNAK